MTLTYTDAAKMIDHALLSPNLASEALDHGCLLAVAYDVASVCIMPFAVPRAVTLLAGSSVKTSTTIGFPHGGHSSKIKRAEAEEAVSQGCAELDMVVNVSKVLSGDWACVRDDIRGVIEVAHADSRRVKVIFENCYLDDEQKRRLCEICGELGADWVKTSTGYGTGGATLDDLRLMRKYSPPHVQVKAAGGIRDYDGLLEARAVGVTRVGASRTAEILGECRRRLGLEPIQFQAAATPSGY
ncbi:MAG: Deoxyribose-phosphate aldolase 2 [Pseudomonadota bacterium]|jgi:deoxyribose-phosphate aldolase